MEDQEPKGRAVKNVLAFALLSPFALALGACAPDVPQNASPSPTIVVEFDPASSVVPSPNDLARATGQVVVPPSATDTPAQAEFNLDYLGSLTAFPQESTGQVLVSGPLDPATVTAQSVLVLDITTPTAPAPVSGVTRALDPVVNAIDILPPSGAWVRAHQYAVALIAGPGGLTGANGEPVIGSPTWALVSSPQPLVVCPAGPGGTPDFASTSCRATVDVIPSTVTDPLARLIDQGQKAAQLEMIREGYAPLLGAVEAIEGLPDASRIPILWTFTIVDAGEVTFDPANGVIPFPNDVLRTGGIVTLPNPTTGLPLLAADCASPTSATVALYCGLNTLDGFSTTVAPISENGLANDAVAQATVDPATLTALSVGLVRIASAAPTAEQTPNPIYTPCLNCVSSPQADGTAQASPQQLQWRLDAPLDEKTTYLAYVTGDVKDDQQKNVIATPAFALVRSKNPIAVGGKSQVNVLTDAQATQLEPLRAALSPVLDGLEAAGVPRTSLTLAWAFTTQSEATLLDQLNAYVSGPVVQALMLPQGAVIFTDATAKYMAAAGATGAPTSAIGKFYAGVFLTPVTVTGPGGTFDGAHPQVKPVTFGLAVPAAAPPAAGYPVSIFGHGITRDRNDFVAIANSLALAGQATIATDVIFHGERTSCTGAGAFLSQVVGMSVTDDAACANPVTMMCNEDPLIGRCVARNPAGHVACPGFGVPGAPYFDATGNLGCQSLGAGACVPAASGLSGQCEGGDFLRDSGGRPVISGWNIFSLTNFFATRDNFRQQVIDLAQLVHTLRVTGPRSIATLAGTTFDLTRIGYVGQSLGGILGTLYNAVSPDTTNVVLDVPGGDLTQIILTSPSFASQSAALVAGLALQGISPGTPAFDQFIGTAQWIVDPADPANMGWRLTHPVSVAGATPAVIAPNVGRQAFIQFIAGDQTVPNSSNFALVAAANRDFTTMPPSLNCVAPLSCYEFTDTIDHFDTTSAPLANRHGFLLQPPSTQPAALQLTAKAQLQAATFLALGHLP
jgi:hypothetical protein